MEIINRLNSIRNVQSGKTSTIVLEENQQITGSINYAEMFEIIFPIVSQYWGYLPEEKETIATDAKKNLNLKELVKGWMADCITYDIKLDDKLYPLCLHEFNEKLHSLRTPISKKYVPTNDQLKKYGFN